MKYNRRMAISAVWFVLGMVLLVLGAMELVDDFWSGMGGGLLAVGIVRMIQLIRYKTNTSYREQVDTQNKDERNRYIATKAWAWTGYLFVMIMAAAVIGLKLMGQNQLSAFAGGIVCLVLVLYWGAYYILQKRY